RPPQVHNPIVVGHCSSTCSLPSPSPLAQAQPHSKHSRHRQSPLLSSALHGVPPNSVTA
ncbi:Pumilio homolog 23, partial [Zea mays]